MLTERTESAVDSRNRKDCPVEFTMAYRIIGDREPKNEPPDSTSLGAMINIVHVTRSRISWEAGIWEHL